MTQIHNPEPAESRGSAHTANAQDAARAKSAWPGLAVVTVTGISLVAYFSFSHAVKNHVELLRETIQMAVKLVT